MPFRDTNRSLQDIAEAVSLIEQFTARMDFEAFREDPKTVAAVERKLLVISEAQSGSATKRKRAVRVGLARHPGHW